MRDNEAMQSILFAIVAGSSRLFEKLDGAEALYAVDRCMKRISRGVDGFRGRIVKTTNRDEISALFENADEACQAAIAMQRRIADLPPVSGVQLQIRVGFHHGPTVQADGDLQGSAVHTARYLAELARPGEVLISSATRDRLSPFLQSSTRYLEKLSVTGQAEEQQVFEVLWLLPGSSPSPAVVEAEASVEAKPRASSLPKVRDLHLCVHYRGNMQVLDQERPHVLMGRDAGCDITVQDRRASRHHARIDRRGEHFVLRDLSTNGTFVTVNGEPELFLKREEFVLRHSGVIAFASSANDPEADFAEFELL